MVQIYALLFDKSGKNNYYKNKVDEAVSDAKRFCSVV